MRRPTVRAPAQLAAAVFLFLLVLPAAASARSTQEAIFQSDGLLTQSGLEVQRRTMDELKNLGVDTVRVLVLWSRVAPGPDSRRKPSFDSADPNAYPAGAFDIYQSLLDRAAERGMGVILTPTGPGPAWASRCRGSLRTLRSCRPSPTEFGRFVLALGLRFPHHRRWAIWNEPNVSSWLMPQYVRRSGRNIPEAARWYRYLVTSALGALRATGHGKDLVLIGETAPIGNSGLSLARRPTASATFLRALFCLSARNRRLAGKDARLLGCSGRFRQMTAASGIATHPYGRGGSRSPLLKDRRDEITIGSLYRLKAIVRAARRYGRIPRLLPIWLTEHGYQTRPPDPLLGVSLAAQAAWINLSDYLAWRDGWVRGMSQYLLRDDHSIGKGFQSGLRFASGRLKPSYAAYRVPLWVSKFGSRAVKVWGQVRPAADHAPERVQIQWRARGSRRYRTVATATTRTKKGVFRVTLRRQRGYWRLRWKPSTGGPVRYSRTATAAKP